MFNAFEPSPLDPKELSHELTELCASGKSEQAARALVILSPALAAAVALDVHQSLTVSFGSLKAAFWRTAVGKVAGMPLL